MNDVNTISSVRITFGQLQLLEAAGAAERIHVTGPNKTAATVLERQGLGHLEVGNDGWHFAINEAGRDQLRLRASV